MELMRIPRRAPTELTWDRIGDDRPAPTVKYPMVLEYGFTRRGYDWAYTFRFVPTVHGEGAIQVEQGWWRCIRERDSHFGHFVRSRRHELARAMGGTYNRGGWHPMPPKK